MLVPILFPPVFVLWHGIVGRNTHVWGRGREDMVDAFIDQGLSRCDTRSACRSAGAEQSAAELAMWRRLLLASLSLTLPVYFIAVVMPHNPWTKQLLDHLVLGFPLGQLLKWALTTPIQVQLLLFRYQSLNSAQKPVMERNRLPLCPPWIDANINAPHLQLTHIPTDALAYPAHLPSCPHLRRMMIDGPGALPKIATVPSG